MDEINIVEIKKNIYALLERNRFEKKLNGKEPEPFSFSYIKRGNLFEMEIKFPKNEFEHTPMVATLSFLRFNIKSGLQFSYDLYERMKDDFLEFIYKELIEEYKNSLLREVQDDLK